MDDLYFRQIQLGPMANFVYLIGSLSTREALVVDPAWDVDGLLDAAEADGMKVVAAYEKAYGVSGEAFALSRGVLKDYGNMSSVTALFVLDRYMELCGTNGEGYGVVSALGPGFCSESLLLRL